MKSICYTLLTIFFSLVLFGTTTNAFTPKGVIFKDGWYFIKNPDTGKYLQVSGAKNANAAGNLVISTGRKDRGQKWKITNLGSSGLVTFTSALGDFRIDVTDGDDSNGANIQLSKTEEAVSQQFMIITTTLENVYSISSKVSSFLKVLEVEDGRSVDGTNVIQQSNALKGSQAWIFEKDSESEEAACWSLPLGYPCCSGCDTVYYRDSDGDWSIENNNWCGLSPHC